MGIYIKGMDMPVIDLEWTIRHGTDGKWYAIDTNAETSNGEWHEIISVPPHGRLIDAAELQRDIHEHDYILTDEWNSKDKGIFTNGIDYAISIAPTIIPASEEEA